MGRMREEIPVSGVLSIDGKVLANGSKRIWDVVKRSPIRKFLISMSGDGSGISIMGVGDVYGKWTVGDFNGEIDRVVVDARDFVGVVKTLKGSVELIKMGNRLHIKCGGFKCDLQTDLEDNFPSFFSDNIPKVIHWSVIQWPNLYEVLKFIFSAMSSDETRYNICCARIDVDNERIVATDGSRLHYVGYYVGHHAEELVKESFSIPRGIFEMIVKQGKGSCSTLEIYRKDNLCRVMLNNGVYSFEKEVEFEGYPDYDNIIKPGNINLTLKTNDKDSLLNSLKNAASMCKVNGGFVEIMPKDGRVVMIPGLLDQIVEIDLPLEVIYYHSHNWHNKDIDKDWVFGINPDYFIDAIQPAVKSVRLNLQDELSPIHIIPDTLEFGAVVMPVRI